MDRNTAWPPPHPLSVLERLQLCAASDDTPTVDVEHRDTMTAAIPPRPVPVTVGAAMLLGSALVLIVAWALGVDAVDNNGGRVFFVVLWGFLAWAAYNGSGWVRIAVVAVFVVTVLGFVSAPSFDDAVRALPTGDVISKILALASLPMLWSTPARRWFAANKESRESVEAA